MKRDKLDIIFSKLVRERADWTCEMCGKKFPEDAPNLHCSHIYGRRYRSTRWHGNNATAMCFACHRSVTEQPLEFSAWVLATFGEGHCTALKTRRNAILKLSKPEKEEFYQFMKAQLERLKEKRNDGETGRLEFEEWLK